MKKKSVFILLLLPVILSFTGCGVSQDEYDNLLKEQEELMIQLQEVRKDYNDLQDEYDNLKAEYDNYKTKIDATNQSTETSYYDTLQNLFLTLSLDSTKEDLEGFVQQYDLPYTSKEYADNTICYIVAFTEESARQTHAESGDRLEVNFSQENGILTYAEYTSNTHSCSALLYNYGTWFYLNQKAPGGKYTGYYIIDPFSDKPGITIKYDNGNETETNYFRCDTAKDALQQVLFS